MQQAQQRSATLLAALIVVAAIGFFAGRAAAGADIQRIDQVEQRVSPRDPVHVPVESPGTPAVPPEVVHPDD